MNSCPYHHSYALSTECILPNLSAWHIALIVIGTTVLMAALILLGVLIIGGFCYEKSES